ncbi:cold shock domain-containing protein [Aridibaculum aurantiacum]|uniref:cold shock domain-containing protein n=1 Tax=Aridibaculum aurantiacum TaxID=2810307 RepID=UPI001A958EA0|nr:cold shock domain-containing protein [Aridibaculum aurantiacum]
MAKSKATFSKREKEKNKLKKRQDKEEKKAERKNDARNGNNLDEMLAYVDEFGNISSTPPDMSRRKEIKAEDIEIGVVYKHQEEDDSPKTGVVTMFNHSKGFGFITDSKTKEQIFVHISALETQVNEQDKVTFEVEAGQKGLKAVNVKKI